MNIIEKLKTFGVEITEDMEKAFSGEFVSAAEVTKKSDKIKTLEDEVKTLKDSQDGLQNKLTELQKTSGDAETWKAQVDELTRSIENERKQWALKEESDRLSSTVEDFFKDKHFVNDITAGAIKTQLVSELQKDTAKGKSISDLFDSIVKDEKGEVKPNILIDEQTLDAERRRSGIIGRSIQLDSNANYTTAQLMKLKNDNPGLDITPYLKKIKERK